MIRLRTEGATRSAIPTSEARLVCANKPNSAVGDPGYSFAISVFCRTAEWFHPPFLCALLRLGVLCDEDSAPDCRFGVAALFRNA